MKAFLLFMVLGIPVLAGGGERPASAAPDLKNVRANSRRSDVIPPARPSLHPLVLPPRPPAPEGITDIGFEDFFQLPVGPLGLEYTAKIQALNGRRVRIAGYQVAEMVGNCNAEPDAGSKARKARALLEASVPGRVLLAPQPETVNFAHYGLCEDLPPQMLFVTAPEFFGQIMPHHFGALLLTGILEVGSKSEPDGRISFVRLVLDPAPALPPTPASPATAAASSATIRPNIP